MGEGRGEGNCLFFFLYNFLCLLCLIVFGGCATYQSKDLAPDKIAANLEKRTLSAPGLRSFLETNLHQTTIEWPRPRWGLDELTLAAFYYHPDLNVARAEWQIADAAVQSAGGRLNPTLNVTPGYSMNAASGVSPWFPAVTLDIPLETAGKRGYRIAQAKHLAEATRLKITTAAWQIRSSLSTALIDFAAAQERAKLLEHQIALQREITSRLEQRLEAGAVARNELTPNRILQARAEADLADAQRLAAEARARVAEAIGVPASALNEITLEFPLTAQTAGIDVSARDQALQNRADILAALAEYAASQSALQLEVARQYPDVHFSPGYQFDQGEHKWSLGLSVELPVLNQNHGPIAEAKARREAAAARFVALQAKVIAEIDRALASHSAAMDQINRQSQLARMAAGQVTSVEVLVQSGAADRLDLSSAQLEASASELFLLESRVNATRAELQLEAALQIPVPTWPKAETLSPLTAIPEQP